MRNKKNGILRSWSPVAVTLVVGNHQVTTEWALAWEKLKPVVRKSRRYGFIDRLATIMWEEI